MTHELRCARCAERHPTDPPPLLAFLGRIGGVESPAEARSNEEDRLFFGTRPKSPGAVVLVVPERHGSNRVAHERARLSRAGAPAEHLHVVNRRGSFEPVPVKGAQLRCRRCGAAPRVSARAAEAIVGARLRFDALRSVGGDCGSGQVFLLRPDGSLAGSRR